MEPEIRVEDFVNAYLKDDLVAFGEDSYAVESLNLDNDFRDVMPLGRKGVIGSLLAGKSFRAALVSPVPGKTVDLEARTDHRWIWRLTRAVATESVPSLT